MIVAVPVGKLARFLESEYVKWSVAADGIAPTNGLRVKGADESSGWGSIDITAVPPAISVGNVRPLGALTRKSSPGNGGPP